MLILRTKRIDSTNSRDEMYYLTLKQMLHIVATDLYRVKKIVRTLFLILREIHLPQISGAPPIQLTEVSCKQKTGAMTSKEGRTKCQHNGN
jgi:hypothetical protein